METNSKKRFSVLDENGNVMNRSDLRISIIIRILWTIRLFTKIQTARVVSGFQFIFQSTDFSLFKVSSEYLAILPENSWGKFVFLHKNYWKKFQQNKCYFVKEGWVIQLICGKCLFIPTDVAINTEYDEQMASFERSMHNILLRKGEGSVEMLANKIQKMLA